MKRIIVELHPQISAEEIELDPSLKNDEIALKALRTGFPLLLPTEYKLQLEIIEGLWIITGHLLYKEWVKKEYRLPFHTKVRLAIEPFANLFNKIRELCKECHSGALPYIDKDTWFTAIVEESRKGTFNEIGQPEIEEKNHKKSYLIKEHTRLIKVLKADKNPYNQTEIPHTWTLIQTCIGLNRRRTSFREKYWESFLGAYQKWVKVIDRNPNWRFLSYSKSGKLVMQAGRGRGQITL